MPDGEVSLGELSRNLTAMEGRVNAKFQEVNRRLDSQQYVLRETYVVQIAALVDRVVDLEDSKKWLARTLAAAFFVAFLAPILVAVVLTR